MLFTETQLEYAFSWLCYRRRNNYPDHADVWHLRFHWAREKAHLFQQLQNRCYQFSPLQKVQKANGEVIHLWSARDALVLKVLSMLLAEVSPTSPACTHVKGHGGLKSTVRRVHDQLPNHLTRPSSGASCRDLIFSAITSPAGQSGSRSKPSSISWHGFADFTSERVQRPKALMLWRST
jgi:hypothetical protein